MYLLVCLVHKNAEYLCVTIYDKVPIQAVEKPSSCFEVVSMDIYGPITPATSQGHQYVLGLICLQSRWVECYPLKTLKSREICDNLLKFCSLCRYSESTN